MGFLSFFSNVAFPWVGGIWAKFGTYILKALAVLALIAAIFMCGYFYRGQKDAEVKTVHAQAQVVATVAAHNQGVVKTLTVYKEDLVKTQALEAKVSALQSKNDYLKGLVNSYVPETPNGPGPYLSPCLVSLLNAGRSGLVDVSDADASAAIFTCKDASPGTLSWGEFVRSYIDLSSTYNVWRDKHNSLVDWDVEHLVNAAPAPATTEPSVTAPN